MWNCRLKPRVDTSKERGLPGRSARKHGKTTDQIERVALINVLRPGRPRAGFICVAVVLIEERQFIRHKDHLAKFLQGPQLEPIFCGRFVDFSLGKPGVF